MWRTRGHRPCRGVRCSSARRIIIGRAVKSQLHDGRISAETASAHSDASWNGVRLQVSLQHLPARPHDIQHELPLEPHVPPGDGMGLAPAQHPERPAASASSDASDRGCDCPPSTSASAMASGGSGADRVGVGRSSRAVNLRDAAALTRRITRTHTIMELQLVVQRYRSQLNSIHVAAAIVKLAKLSNDAASAAARRHPDGSSNHGQQQGSFQHRRWRQQSWQPRQGTATGGAAGEETPPIPAAAAPSPGQPSARSAPAGPAGKGGEGAGKGGDCAALTDAASAKQAGLDAHLRKSARAEGKRGGSVAAPPSPPPAGAALSPSASPRPGPGAPDTPTASTALAAPAATSSSSSPASLLHDLASEFLTQMDQYDTARQFANVVWALGTLRCRDHPQLLTAAAARLLSQDGAKLVSALPQELSNLALGLAKLGYRGVPLWAAIIAAGKARLQAFKPQELHNLAWAVAAASQDRSMISAVVQAALPQLRAFNASGLANLLWACAAAQCPCEELFDGVAERLLAMPPGELNSQDVANTAWAFAKLQHPHPRLVWHLAGLVLGVGPGGLRRVATQELVNLLWAFASLLPPAEQEGVVEQGGHGAGEEQQAQKEQEQRGSAGGSRAGNGGGSSSGAGVGLGNGPQAGDAAGDWGADGRREGPSSSSDPRGSSPGTLQGAAAQRSGAAAASASTLPSAAAASGGPPQGYAAGADSSSSSSSRSVDTSSNNGNAGSVSSSGGGSSSSNGDSGTLLGRLMQLLLTEIVRRADLTPQGIANALWAAGRAQPCPLPAPAAAALLQAAAGAALAGTLSDQELCNALWGAGQLRSAKHIVEPRTVTPLLEAACSPARLERLTPAGLTQVMHAVVALRLVGSGYMDELSKRVLRSLPTLGPQELCVVAAAAAEAAHSTKYCNPILMNGLGNTAAASVERMGPQAMSTILWAFARAKHYHGPLTTAVCRAAQPRLREFSDLELSNLVWALAVLKCQDRQLLVRAARVLVTRVRLRRQRQAAPAPLPRQLQQQRRRQGQPLELNQQQQQPDQVMEDRGGKRQQQRHQQQQQLRNPRQGDQGQSEGVAVGAAALQAQRLSWRDQQARQEHHALQPAHVRQLALAGQQLTYEAAVDGGQPSLEGAGMGSRPGPEGGQAPGPIRIADADGPSTSSDNSRSSSVSVEWRSNGGGGSGGSAAGVPLAADALSATLADVRTRLRHIPLLNHPNDKTSVRLQPHRPPPRDAGADACTATNRRRDSGDGAAADAGMAAHCSSPAGGAADMPPPRPRSSPLSDSDPDDEADGGAGLAAATAQGHAKSMAKLLWSYAKCDMYNQPLYRLLTQELRPLLHLLTPHELTQVLWAVSYHGHSCPELLDAAAAAVTERLWRFSPTDASVVAWSYGKLRHSHPALMAALQRYAADGAQFKQPCLGRLAWACAQLKEPLDERLVRQLQAVQQDARRRLAQSSYDGSDLAISLAGDVSRVESDW